MDKDFSLNFPTAPEHSDITTYIKENIVIKSMVQTLK